MSELLENAPSRKGESDSLEPPQSRGAAEDTGTWGVSSYAGSVEKEIRKPSGSVTAKSRTPQG